MKSYWICLVIFLAVLGYEATRLPDDHEQKQVARDQERETKVSEAVDTVPVVARGVGAVPGAIVCPNLAAVQLTFSLYSESVEDDLQDTITHGQSHLLRGDPIPKPNFEAYGCSFLPAGSPMAFVTESAAGPIVSARLPSGKIVSGITFESMVAGPELEKRREAQKNAREQAQAELQQRYEKIMQPELERHSAAVQQEEARHVAAMRELNPRYVDMFSGMTLDQMSPQERRNADCFAENCRDEEDRHIASMGDENQRYRSAQIAAHERAGHPSETPTQ